MCSHQNQSIFGGAFIVNLQTGIDANVAVGIAGVVNGVKQTIGASLNIHTSTLNSREAAS